MMMMRCSKLPAGMAVFLGVCFYPCQSATATLSSTIATLFDAIKKDQAEKDVESSPGVWSRQKGLFSSSVHLNFNGGPQFTLLRRGISFPDDNMFVTNFVVTYLMEAEKLGSITVDPSIVSSAVDALLRHKSHDAAADIPVFAFWNEKLINGTYVSWPTNLCAPLDKISPVDSFEDLLHNLVKQIGLEKIWPLVHGLTDWPKLLEDIFRIPPDADDTAVNLALSAAVHETDSGMAPRYAEAAAAFDAKASNISGLFSSYYGRYAYRPFSNDPLSSLIDPRTYMWLRRFLAEVKSDSSPEDLEEFSLFTTWFQDVDQIRQHVQTAPGTAFNKAPFNTNNVDPTVNANVLYGITRQVLAALKSGRSAPDWFAPNGAVQQMYSDAARMITWVLNHADVTLFGRADLVLVYYPPIWDFYYFVARTFHLLQNNDEFPESVRVLAAVRDQWGPALRTAATSAMLSKMLSDDKGVYWHDFLGMNEHTPQFEDRIFSSSTVLNALYDIWTLAPKSNAPQSCRMAWRSDTPASVKAAAARGAARLVAVMEDQKVLSHEMENAFFSGSVKSVDSLPFYYPANVREDLILGSPVPCNGSVNFNLLAGVRGLMKEDEYEAALNGGKCFGKPVPQTFHGFNSEGVFPYWSSPTLTRAVTLLALTKAEAVQQCTEQPTYI